MKPAARLSVSLKPSLRLLLILSLAHAVAAVAVLVAALPPWIAAILLLLVGASLARLRRGGTPGGLILHGDGRLETVGAGDTAADAELHPHTLVLPYLVVLLYRQDGRLRSLPVLADSLAAEEFRQLRLWLRWRSDAAAN